VRKKTEGKDKMTKEKRQNWYFTFGSGQVHNGRYSKFLGTREETRKRMFDVFEDKWSMQYSEKQWTTPQDHWGKNDKTMADRWGWREIK
jgi:hypothetical protein